MIQNLWNSCTKNGLGLGLDKNYKINCIVFEKTKFSIFLNENKKSNRCYKSDQNIIIFWFIFLLDFI